MKKDFEEHWECLRKRNIECPLGDKELMLLARTAVDTARVRRWGWLPYITAAALAVVVMSLSPRAAATEYDMAAHGIAPETVVRLNNEMLDAL